MKLGFVGLGRMGAAMAANLVKAGHEVSVYNRTPEKSTALAALGAHPAANLRDVCCGAAVITMLADDDAVAEIVLGPGGLSANLPEGAIHLSMSTISVALSKRLALAQARAGQRYVAAPVFGRPDAAEAAKLFILAAGDPAAIEECQPLFHAMGQRTFCVGADPSAANLIKLSGNFLLASAIEALGEAVALVGKAGIDPRSFVEILTSTLFNAPAYKTYGALIAEGKFEPAAFVAPLGYKDVRLTLAAAESLRVPLPLGNLLSDRFLRLLAHQRDRLDWSAIAGLAAEDAAAGNFKVQ